MADRKFSSGDRVPPLRWLRDFSGRVAASAISALAPLYADPAPGGTRLSYRPEPEFDAIVKATSGAGYTVAEARFNAPTGAWSEVAGGRVVTTAYEYNLDPTVPIGRVVRVRHTPADDWRFWTPKTGSAAVPCSPCPLPAAADLTLYIRRVSYLTGPPATICADDEFTLPLTWSAGTIPAAISPSEPCKPGFYYTPCQNLLDYDSPDDCASTGSHTDRYYLACSARTNRIVLIFNSFGLFSGDGVAACAALNPVTGAGVTANLQAVGVSSWAEYSCTPFALRSQVYSLTSPSFLVGDAWVYET